MLISRPRKIQEGRLSNNTSLIESTTHEVGGCLDCDAEISVDLTHNSLETSGQSKRNITIEITNFNNQSTAENMDTNNVISPMKDKEKLIRLKIKMPKSPLCGQSVKKDKSFFTEKDFSTLPKEFIKFANSMISGDEIIKGQSFRTGFEVKKRYNDKFLNEERVKSPPSNMERYLTYRKSPRTDGKSNTLPCLEYKIDESLQEEDNTNYSNIDDNLHYVVSSKSPCNNTNIADAISPIVQEECLPSSTPKEEDVVTAYPARVKIEPLYFTKKHTLPIPSEFKEAISREYTLINNEKKDTHNDHTIDTGTIVCDVVDKTQPDPKENITTLANSEVNGKGREAIINNLRPYSKYKLQYLNNLDKLRCIPDDSFNIDIDQAVEATEFFNQKEIDESQLKNVVNKSSKYKPIMGKLALFTKMTKHKDDSKIVEELVTEKFNPYFEKRQYHRESLKRNTNKKVNNSNDEVLTQKKHNNCGGVNNVLNQTVPHIIVNEDAYAIIDKANKYKYDNLISIHQDSLKIPPTTICEQQDKTSDLTLQTDYNIQEMKLYQEINFRGANNSDIWPSSKTNELSAYSDYDVEKFLQTAIGDVSLDSQAMNPKIQNSARRNSDDHSIQTAEMSLLISKASSISTFCSAVWRRVTRKNSPKKPQDSDALTQDKLIQEQKNKRVILLQQEAAVQSEVIRQASKALDYCENATDTNLVTHLVEAERVILIASHKCNIIRHEIEDLEHYAKIRSKCSHLGTVGIKNLEFKVQEASGKHDDCTQWFVCILNRGTEVIASKPIQASEDGSVFFKEEFSFDYLAPDFEISVSLFTLKVKKYKDTKRSTFQRMKFLSFRRDPKPANQSLTSRFSRTSLHSPIKESAKVVIRGTSFILLGSTTLTIRDISKTILQFRNVANFANIKESFCATITTDVNIEDRYESFLNIGTESCRQIYWNRRWCVLEGTNFKYWTSPDDDDLQEPLNTIDLSCCIRNVASVDRSLCPRARTLLLEISPNAGNETKHSTAKYFLTSDTTEEMHNLELALNTVIDTLRAWNRLKSIRT